MKIIDNWQTKQLRCHFCGETRSVKYEMDVVDPVVDNKPTKVAVCNKCALTHKEAEVKKLTNIIN